MYYCNLFTCKRYYLCLLFTLVNSLMKSFENWRTIDNYLYPTFQVVFIELDFLEDNKK